MGDQIVTTMTIKKIVKPLFALAIGTLFIGGSSVFTGCSPDKPVTNDSDTVVVPPKGPRVSGPDFNADSAYAFIEAQVAFGPRVPGTPGNLACANYLKDKLTSFGLTVNVQEAPATLYTGRSITMRNIMDLSSRNVQNEFCSLHTGTHVTLQIATPTKWINPLTVPTTAAAVLRCCLKLHA